mmetsp:Transcript_41234/g.101740  ORF Transcript_41234/g.101740 Transcript_41234/m.101740 type:complete len:192 (-) Transcript_41234:100-675(-)
MKIALVLRRAHFLWAFLPSASVMNLSRPNGSASSFSNSTGPPLRPPPPPSVPAVDLLAGSPLLLGSEGPPGTLSSSGGLFDLGPSQYLFAGSGGGGLGDDFATRARGGGEPLGGAFGDLFDVSQPASDHDALSSLFAPAAKAQHPPGAPNGAAAAAHANGSGGGGGGGFADFGLLGSSGPETTQSQGGPFF